MTLTEIITEEDLREPYDRMLEFLSMSEIVKLINAYSGRQVRFSRNYQDIKKDYPELTGLIGADKARMFVRRFSGESGLYFPELKRNCAEKIKALIRSDFNGYNFLALARKYGYTERHIRRIIEGRGNRGRYVNENQMSIFEILES